MPHLTPFPHADASGERKQLMDAVKGQFGAVINMFGTVAHSPAAGSRFITMIGRDHAETSGVGAGSYFGSTACFRRHS